MPATRKTLNNILNYNFGTRTYSTPSQPSSLYFGLSTTVLTPYSNLVANVTAVSYLLKAVTITATNIFGVGDIITVAGVNSPYSLTNIDGTWVCATGTNATTIVFNVSSQPVGTSGQTISSGTVSGPVVTEPAGGSYARTSAYGNTSSPLKWTASTIASLSNTDVITFPQSSAPWGTVQSLFIADSGTTGAGTITWYSNLSPTISVLSNTTLSFAANSVVFTMS